MWLNTSANVVSRQPARLLWATLLNYDLLLVPCPSFLVCIEADCWIDLDNGKQVLEVPFRNQVCTNSDPKVSFSSDALATLYVVGWFLWTNNVFHLKLLDFILGDATFEWQTEVFKWKMGYFLVQQTPFYFFPFLLDKQKAAVSILVFFQYWFQFPTFWS